MTGSSKKSSIVFINNQLPVESMVYPYRTEFHGDVINEEEYYQENELSQENGNE